MQQPIKIAVVGLGRAGWNIHINKLRGHPAFSVAAAVDPDAGRRAEAAAELNCSVFPDIDTLLAETEAELVVVATPNHLHERDAVKVLESGRHCVLEKPMAITHDSALRIITAAEKSSKHLFVHHQRRFGDEFRFLREVIDSGVLGEVFEIRLHWGGFARRNDWQTLRQNSGGVLNNTGPHLLDLAVNLLDAPVTEMLAEMRHVKDAGDCEDHVHLFAKASNGQTADLTVTTACALPAPRTLLLGSCGTLLAMDDKTAKLRYFDPSKVAPLEVVDGPAPERKYGNADVLPWEEEERLMKPSAPGGEFYDNVAAVLAGKEEPVVTPQSAAEVIRLIEWAHRTPTAGLQPTPA